MLCSLCKGAAFICEDNYHSKVVINEDLPKKISFHQTKDKKEEEWKDTGGEKGTQKCSKFQYGMISKIYLGGKKEDTERWVQYTTFCRKNGKFIHVSTCVSITL